MAQGPKTKTYFSLSSFKEVTPGQKLIRIHPSLLRTDGGRQNTPPHPESACLGLLVCGLGILSSTATSLEANNLPRNPATVTPSPKQN